MTKLAATMTWCDQLTAVSADADDWEHPMSDVKRGQNLEAEATATRTMPRPISGG